MLTKMRTSTGIGDGVTAPNQDEELDRRCWTKMKNFTEEAADESNRETGDLTKLEITTTDLSLLDQVVVLGLLTQTGTQW